MKAQELRIGNYVQRLYSKANYDIVTWRDIWYQNDFDNREDKIYRSGGLVEWEVDNKGIELKPIPLTEEWLLKFGIKINEWIWESSYKISFSLGFWDVTVRTADHSKEISFTFIKHVHQLQNLYFTLIGEELKLI